VERFRAEGIRIDGAIAIASVARKSPFVMQTVANVMDMEIELPAGDQAVALGAAMFASTAAGVHPSIDEAQRIMSSGTEATYRPEPEWAKRYDLLYADYLRFGAFVQRELTPHM
jgi:L-ribulokinase